MHGQARQTTLRPPNSPKRLRVQSGQAITWVGPRRALVVKTKPDGSVHVERIERDVPGDGRTYLARVVREIGGQERFVVVGPWPERTALEREYTAIYQRPDRLVDVEPGGSLGADDLDEVGLVDRLLRLGG